MKKGFFVNNMSDLDYIEVSYMLNKKYTFFSYYTNTNAYVYIQSHVIKCHYAEM